MIVVTVYGVQHVVCACDKCQALFIVPDDTKPMPGEHGGHEIWHWKINGVLCDGTVSPLP